MKLESLIIVFLLIIIPIAMVLSQYVDKKIDAEKKELSYNTRLLNSTHDAIKEFQLRTVHNEFSYDTNNKIIDIESAINTFFTSLSSNFGYSGYNKEAMKEYVPAVVFTLYDGYYIYSPYRNTLTEAKNKEIDGVTDPDFTGYDSSYSKEGETYYGLKPYVYYSCRYQYDSNDFVITYTLDNYITIQGTINDQYVYDYGYLYGISDSRNDTNGTIWKQTIDGKDTYWYNGIKFDKDDTEELKEYVGNQLYSYVKINGKKYYLESETDRFANGNYKIFYIDKHGEKNYEQFKTDSNENTKAYNAIKGNKSAYEYYKNAYEFSERVLTNKTNSQLSSPKDKMGNDINGGYNLKNNLNAKHAIFYKEIIQQKDNNTFTSNGIIDLTEYGDFNVFDYNATTTPPQFEDSNFNKHRKSIIRYVVETNLLPAITSYASNSVDEFLMPKIKDTDWDLIENNVCAISFMQGMNIGSKKYNGYSVVANSLTKEYVDEDDIYIVSGNKYYRVNDNCFDDASMSLFEKVKWDVTNNEYMQANTNEGFYAGISKLDFEQRRILQDKSQTIYYYPQHPLGSYTSIFGSNGIKPIKKDMYQYVLSLGDGGNYKKIKEIYYSALGRERWSSFNINNINFELYGSNEPVYFLKSYE